MNAPQNQVTAGLEMRLKALEDKVGGWFKNNWAHFVTWATLIYGIVKHL